MEFAKWLDENNKDGKSASYYAKGWCDLNLKPTTPVDSLKEVQKWADEHNKKQTEELLKEFISFCLPDAYPEGTKGYEEWIWLTQCAKEYTKQLKKGSL